MTNKQLSQEINLLLMSSLIFGLEKLCQVEMQFICLAWPPYVAIWKARNRACFEKKLIKNPNEVSYSASLFMHFWAGLFKGDMQNKVKAGADVLMKVALSIGEGSSLGTGRRMITKKACGRS
jgi:hypothetical protein